MNKFAVWRLDPMPTDRIRIAWPSSTFHMVVDYVILPDAKLHSAGIVRGLDRSL